MKHTPCGNCPFRKDVPAYIRLGAAREFRDALEHDSVFHCHRTVDYLSDDDGHATADSEFCSGALALLEKTGGANRNLVVRLGAHLGFIDLDQLDLDTVFDSWDDWFAHIRKDGY